MDHRTPEPTRASLGPTGWYSNSWHQTSSYPLQPVEGTRLLLALSRWSGFCDKLKTYRHLSWAERQGPTPEKS
jgi:hypothetical protein